MNLSKYIGNKMAHLSQMLSSPEQCHLGYKYGHFKEFYSYLPITFRKYKPYIKYLHKYNSFRSAPEMQE